ncbi:MAG: dienelactone hydrolase family protein [Alcanivorax sp.]|nr:dienelactone hydrolase family protein [Alcanivorax sp.]
MQDIVSRAVNYRANGQDYRGELLHQAGARPTRALLMAPNFLGVTDAALHQARQRLDANSVIFILDPYGVGRRPQDPQQAAAAIKHLRANPQALRPVLHAALSALRHEAVALGVAEENVAIFGFCFGGACVLELARSGAQARAFISFHGLLTSDLPATQTPSGPLLILNGADDPMVGADGQAAFQKEMDAVGADWTLVNYSGTVHSFTDPGANIPGRSVYNPTVARRAFAAMDDLLNEVFEHGLCHNAGDNR